MIMKERGRWLYVGVFCWVLCVFFVSARVEREVFSCVLASSLQEWRESGLVLALHSVMIQPGFSWMSEVFCLGARKCGGPWVLECKGGERVGDVAVGLLGSANGGKLKRWLLG